MRVLIHKAATGDPKVAIGPHYYDFESTFKITEAYNALLKATPGINKQIAEVEIEALMDDNLLRVARLEYSVLTTSDNLFRKTMIQDGTLVVLQCMVTLGFPILQYGNFRKYLETKNDLEAFKWLFFPGNQLPNRILRRVTKLQFFRMILATSNLHEPRDPFRKAIYLSLFSPIHEIGNMLGALHEVILGEDQLPLRSTPILDEGHSPSATALATKRIKFKGDHNIGVRGIIFTTSLFGGVLHRNTEGGQIWNILLGLL